MSNLKKNVISGLKWSLFGKLISQLLSWSVTFIVIRILLPSDYGIIELSGVAISLAVVLGVSGLSDIIVMSKEHDAQLCNQVFTIATLLNTTFFVIIYITAPLLAEWYDSPDITGVMRLLSFNILLITLTVIPSGILKRDMNFKKLALIQLFQGVTNSIITLSLALMDYGFWAIAFGSVGSTLCFCVLMNFYVRVKVRLTTDFAGFQSYLKFGFFTVLNQVLNLLFQKADIIIIGKVLGTRPLGYYAVGSQLANLPLEKIAQTLNEISFSGFAKIKNDRPAISYYFLQSSIVIAFVSFPVFWGLTSVAEPLISLVVGEKWLDAVPVFQVLALVMPFRIFQLAFYSSIAGVGHPKFNTESSIIFCLVVPIAVYIGLDWGLLGAACGWAFGYMLAFSWLMIRSLRFLEVSILDFSKCIFAPITACTSMLLLNLYLYDDMIIQKDAFLLIEMILTGSVVYLASMFLLDRGAFKSLARILQINRK